MSTKLHDNQDSFSFDIVRMPFFNNHKPSKILYFSIDSEILGLARNTSDCVTFIMLFDKLLDRISKQEIRKEDIIILLNKIFGRHFEVFIKT